MQPRPDDADRRAYDRRPGYAPGALLMAGEVAQLLGVPRTWVYEQSRCGRIPTVTLGRYRRYRQEAIESWLQAIESPARGSRAHGGRSS